jgi:hypothetical protein
MYWGDDFDQQQAYVDVHAIHRALQSGGSLSDAIAELQVIRQTQLIPWLETDLAKLAEKWGQAAGILLEAAQ